MGSPGFVRERATETESEREEGERARRSERESEGKGPPRLTMQPDLWPGRTYIELHTIS